MLKIIIGGAMGRMGKELTAIAAKSDIEAVCGVDLRADGSLPYPCFTGYGQIDADVCNSIIIDFSKPATLEELLPFALRNKLPCVLCATGYSDEQLSAVAEAGKQIPILRSANMSLGINLMQELAAMAARTLQGYDCEIVEKHHCMKQDAPSGTALMLYDAVAAERPQSTRHIGRGGAVCPREDNEIGIAAVRGGTVVGEHEVGFYGDGEELILTHRAEARSLFAKGAVFAAEWLQGCSAGVYGMRDAVRTLLEK